MEARSLRLGLLGTNHVPSPKEYDFIRQVLVPIYDQQVHELDTEIERVQALLKALHVERQKQHELLEAHKALLTPMRRLNPDVLLEIFHHCRSQCLEAPMRLARVCRKWRALVLSTPTLWTIISLHDTMLTQRIVPFARACAMYSGFCPIKVVVKFMRNLPNTQMVRRALFEALDILAHHIHRWQTLEVFLTKKFEPDNGNLFKLPGSAPLLERLVLMTDTAIPFQFLYLPKLRDLRLSGIMARDIPLLLQYTTLHVLFIGGKSAITAKDCWTILSNCLELEKFEVTSFCSNSPFVPEREITLSSLHQLSLGPSTADLGSLMSSIKTPVLKELRLLNNSRPSDTSWLTRLVEESRPPLTRLSLANVAGTDVAACLPHLPDLTSLLLQCTFDLDLVIGRLTEQDDNGKFYCPLLMHLGLRLCFLTGRILLHFARERRRMAGGLKVVVEKWGYEPGDFMGLTIELSQIEAFTDSELKELYDMQT